MSGGGDGYHQGVLSVLVDSCANLLGGRTGLRAPMASARLELCGISQVTDPPSAPSAAPVYAHRMVFLVRDPAADTLKVAVVDEKTGEEVGALRLELSELLMRPGMQRSNCPYSLRQSRKRGDRGFRRDGGKQPCIFMSLAFR